MSAPEVSVHARRPAGDQPLGPRKPLELHRSLSCRHRISAGVQAQPKLPKCNCQAYGAEGGPGPAGLCRAEDTEVNETGE